MALLFAEQEKTQSLEARVAQLQALLAAHTTKHAQHIDTLKDSRDMHKRGEESERKASVAAQVERDAMRDERDKALARVAELEGLGLGAAVADRDDGGGPQERALGSFVEHQDPV